MDNGNPFTGELLHFNAIRMRIVGSGNLQLTLNSLDSIHSSDLAQLAMSSATNREPTVLSNFVDQRAQLIGFTNQMDEWFNISRIIIYVRPTFSSYPQ